MLNNKKGQIGESMTWIVATIILIIILMIFIYASIFLAKTKSFNINVNTESKISNDWISAKTNMAYTINNKNKIEIERWISEERGNE